MRWSPIPPTNTTLVTEFLGIGQIVTFPLFSHFFWNSCFQTWSKLHQLPRETSWVGWDRTWVGLFHFVYGASPQHILLHFPIKLLHLPIKFASFPQQIASFPQQFASFPQQIASFPQHSFSLPQHILCHFAKHRIKVFSAISLVFCRF